MPDEPSLDPMAAASPGLEVFSGEPAAEGQAPESLEAADPQSPEPQLQSEGQEGQPAASAAPSPAAQHTLPANVAAEIADKAVRGVLEGIKSTPPPQRQPTPEEQQAQFEKAFGVVKLDENFIAQYDQADPAGKAALLNDFGQNVVKQSVRMAQYAFQQFMAQREAQYQQLLAPLVRAHQSAEMSRLENKFFSKFPHLKDYASVAKEVRAKFAAAKANFKTEDEALQAVADETTRILRSINVIRDAQPGAAPQPGATPQVTPTTPARKPAPLATGGHGGGGATPSNKGTSSTARRIFG